MSIVEIYLSYKHKSVHMKKKTEYEINKLHEAIKKHDIITVIHLLNTGRYTSDILNQALAIAIYIRDIKITKVLLDTKQYHQDTIDGIFKRVQKLMPQQDSEVVEIEYIAAPNYFEILTFIKNYTKLVLNHSEGVGVLNPRQQVWLSKFLKSSEVLAPSEELKYPMRWTYKPIHNYVKLSNWSWRYFPTHQEILKFFEKYSTHFGIIGTIMSYLQESEYANLLYNINPDAHEEYQKPSLIVDKMTLPENHWYSDNEINRILEQLLRDSQQNNVRSMSAIGVYTEHAVLGNGLVITDEGVSIGNESSIESIRLGISAMQLGDVLLIPINVNYNHWIGANVTRDEHGLVVTFMDSITGQGRVTQQNAIEWLFREAIQGMNMPSCSLNGTVPEMSISFSIMSEAMQQDNGYDCGPMTIYNLLESSNYEYRNGELQSIQEIRALYQLYNVEPEDVITDTTQCDFPCNTI